MLWEMGVAENYLLDKFPSYYWQWGKNSIIRTEWAILPWILEREWDILKNLTLNINNLLPRWRVGTFFGKWSSESPHVQAALLCYCL